MTWTVAVLWTDHGLAPSETLNCPPGIFEAAVARLAQRNTARPAPISDLDEARTIAAMKAAANGR